MTKIRSYILTLFLISIVPHIKAQDDNDIPPPMITITGNGEVRIQPDQALVNIGVELHDKSVQDLRKQIDDTASNIIAYLKDQNIEDKDIQTSHLSVQPFYNYTFPDTGSTDPDYYIGTKTMIFVLRNLGDYDAIMSGLYDLGLNRVDGVTFRVTNYTEPQLEARRRAVANAKEIASALAEVLGVQLGNVYSISENSFPTPMFSTGMLAAADSAGSGSSGPSISAGETVFSSSVTVVFYIVQ